LFYPDSGDEVVAFEVTYVSFCFAAAVRTGVTLFLRPEHTPKQNAASAIEDVSDDNEVSDVAPTSRTGSRKAPTTIKKVTLPSPDASPTSKRGHRSQHVALKGKEPQSLVAVKSVKKPQKYASEDGDDDTRDSASEEKAVFPAVKAADGEPVMVNEYQDKELRTIYDKLPVLKFVLRVINHFHCNVSCHSILPDNSVMSTPSPLVWKILLECVLWTSVRGLRVPSGSKFVSFSLSFVDVLGQNAWARSSVCSVGVSRQHQSDRPEGPRC
jgi:hypothetical protein